MLWWTKRRFEKQVKSGLDYVRQDAFRELARLRGSGAVKLLTLFAEDGTNPMKVRFGAIDALGKRGDVGSVAVLIHVLENQTVPIGIRRAAAQAIGDVGDAEGVEPLIRAAERPDLQHAAAGALGKIGDQRAVPVLLRELGNAWPEAATVLDKLEPDWRNRPEVADVAKLLVDSLVTCGRWAVLALDAIDQNWRTGAAARAAIPAVLAALATHSQGPDRNSLLVQNAAWAIGAIGVVGDQQAITLLTKACLDPYDRGRKWEGDAAMESAVTVALEKLSPDYIGPESSQVASLFKKHAALSSTDTELQAVALRELERLLEQSVAIISSDCLRRVATMKREVIRYTGHATRDDEPYILHCEFDTAPCVDLASREIQWREAPKRYG